MGDDVSVFVSLLALVLITLGGLILIMTEKQKNKEDNRQNSAATEQHKELRDIRLKYGADSEEYKEVSLNIQGKQKIDQSAKDRLQERQQQQQQTKQIKQKKTLLKIGE